MRSALAVLLVAPACSSSTMSMRVEGDPIQRVAAAADSTDGWVVTDRTATSVSVREAWPVHSAAALGFSAFHGELWREESTLWARFYLQTNSLFTLGFSQTIDLEDGAYGALLKSRMRESASLVLDWAGVPRTERPAVLAR